jgi:hypothetical protein
VDDELPLSETLVRCPRSLRDTWPTPLAAQWRDAYPQLFDDDDLRLTVTQPWTHFWEWFAAMHIYERDGAYSLIEKYNCLSHPRKRERYESLLTAQEQAALHEACSASRVQVPDLLVYAPDMSRYHFAEIKGPGDRLSVGQRESHDAIKNSLGVQVEVIRVVVDEDA